MRWSFACLVLTFALASVGAFASVPEGTSYIQASVTAGAWVDANVKTAVANWLASNALSTASPAVNSSHVVIYDFVAGSPNTVNIAIEHPTLTIIEIYPALIALNTPFGANSVLPVGYTVVTSSAVENFVLNVIMSIGTFGSVYVNKIAGPYYVQMDYAPRYNSYVDIALTAVTGTIVGYNTSSVRIQWPWKRAAFMVVAQGTPGSSACILTPSGPDTVGRGYTTSGATALNQMTVVSKENIVVTQPSTAYRVYEFNPTPNFFINAPTNLYATFDLIVAVRSTPLNLSVTPSANMSITQRNVDYAYRLSGPAGVYTVSFIVNPPWLDPTSLVWRGTSNDEFNPIATTFTVHVRKRLNITVNNVPDSFMVAPYFGPNYGGAYSKTSYIYVQDDPNSDITLNLVAQPNLEVSPTSLTFSYLGAESLDVTYRARVPGHYSIQWVVSGTNKDDYITPLPTRKWIVYGNNPVCRALVAATPCWAANGCIWNANRSKCQNTTLNIAIQKIPLLFSTERSDPLWFYLPTPVPNQLVVTFYASARFTFTPASITMSAGATNASFQITGTVLSSDDGVIDQTFQMRLSGTSANYYTQQVSFGKLRKRIVCKLTTAYGFFVYTKSDWFTIECDTAPETEVYFLPAATSGIEFYPEFSLTSGGRNARAVYLDSTQTMGRFYANSTSSRTGTIPLSISIGGTNALRLDPIPSTTFRVLPSGEVLLPPDFTMTQFTTSPMLNLDLSVLPNKLFWIDIAVELNNTNATTNVTVSPTRVFFNDTQRGFFNVTANGTGFYYFRFTINGENVPNYIKPTTRTRVMVQDPLDGPAFEARQRRGYLNYRKQCRVSTGRRSVRFDGQDEPLLRDEFCSDIPRPWSNISFDCRARLSVQQCQAAVERLGHACAWLNNRCEFLPTLQGNIQHAQFGSGFTVFLTLQGEVWTIGVDRYGQLGHHNTSGIAKVPLPESIATIAVGNNNVLALSYEGRVYTWGVNSKGQLGQNTRASSSVVPGLVPFPKGENITCISAGVLHSAALTLSGRLYTWGSNEYGQLGIISSYRYYVNNPKLVSREFFGGDAAIAVQCGEYHTMVATDNGAYTFGSNIMGQLGRVGFDEWMPKSPVLWVRNKYNQGPKYSSYWLGKQC